MNYIYGILAILVVLGLILGVLAYIGLKVKQQDMKDNVEAINKFVAIQKQKKYSRKATPKVPTIKK